MIKPIKEDLIKEPAKHGASQRSIAKQLGISRNTVSGGLSGTQNSGPTRTNVTG